MSEPRKITDHILESTGLDLEIRVLDGPGPGGACHRYEIVGTAIGAGAGATPYAPSISSFRQTITFQRGAGGVEGAGITNEALLAIVADRLSGFQAGPFPCGQNRQALDHVQAALSWLHERTAQRTQRGVEGREVA